MRLLEQQQSMTVDHDAIAESVGLSRFRLHHLFLEEMGETPGSYLRRIRMDLAAMRLCWTHEPASHIAHGLGYASQSSFNRTFVSRFGLSPSRYRSEFLQRRDLRRKDIDHPDIIVREVDSFHCLAKRYFGPLSNVPEKWADFLEQLPDEFASSTSHLFLGCVYDDPRITPPQQIRYDCCIVIPAASEQIHDRPPAEGLHLVRTRSGLYSALEHKGNYHPDIAASYSSILDYWMAGSRRYVMADDAAIEVYAVPPPRSAHDTLACTILIPLI